MYVREGGVRGRKEEKEQEWALEAGRSEEPAGACATENVRIQEASTRSKSKASQLCVGGLPHLPPFILKLGRRGEVGRKGGRKEGTGGR